MTPPNSILDYYIVRSKMMNKALDPETYDKLILQNQGDVNNQGHIVLMNIGVVFYETYVNFAKNTKNSKSILIRQFLYGLCKVLAIEPTSDTEDLGKWILIVHNDNYSDATNKLDKLIAYLYKEKFTLPTMISSFEQFHMYPEMNGGMPVDNTTRAKVAALNLELASQPVPPTAAY